jgi:Subtilase family/Peptidase inhibitor I9
MWTVALLLYVQTVFAIVARPSPLGKHELPHTYLIQFEENTPAQVRDEHLDWIRTIEKDHPHVGLRHVFSLAFNGYSAVLNDATLDKVRLRDEVISIDHVGLSAEQPPLPDHFTNHVEAVQRIHTEEWASDKSLGSVDPIGQGSRVAPEGVFTTPNKGWNANRISHRNFSAGYNTGPWVHDRYLGAGVKVYVLDTGVNLKQPGFNGSQVTFGKNFVGWRAGVSRTDNQDNHGHGTMCAGVIAGTKHGLSPEAHMVAVKIADDNNRSACDDVVAGVEWVLAQPGSNNMKVISMSHYGFIGKPDVATAVTAAVKKGLHFVVCAGNDGKDSCRVQPSNAKGVIAVGSVNAFNKIPIKGETDAGGRELEGSNVGECVTVFAPGTRVPTLSTKNLDPGYRYFSWGTSVAAPQVAALVANRLSAIGPQTPAQIKTWLQTTATKGQVEGDLKGAPNLIVYNGAGNEILQSIVIAPAKRDRGSS